jgi:heterodisulfide reductase subunit C
MFFNLAGQLGIFHKAEVHIGMNYYQKKFWKKIRLSVRQMSDVQNSWMCVRCS